MTCTVIRANIVVEGRNTVHIHLDTINIVQHSVLVNYTMLGGEYSLAQVTEYGKAVKKRLIDINQTQEWLMKEVTEKTGRFVDSGYLYKIMAGQRKAPAITAAINEILGLKTNS